ncbi:flagellar basal body rod protein FlgG [Sporosarcina koreensis]|uniref:flagellar basal body rod protein FlgG n=1 Tax=Sporosarcina koreensis TaxID=334735 RepID=UPI00058C0728|nr:flagellar basal body rod protein FlgG [Sporosarcina koreensis]
MLRSMYAGISGLKNFQTKLDVIGNNISNVNTYGFKKGRTVFKDLYSQTVSGASGPTPGGTGANPANIGRGGVNPKQVGLGSQLATIDTLMSPGSTQFTGNTLDLAIEGDGFFAVKAGDTIQYTRAGNFYLDEKGALVDGDGRFVMVSDFSATPPTNPTTVTNLRKIEIPLTATSLSIGQNGVVSYVNNGNLVEAGVVQIAKFNNPAGLEKVGGNLYVDSTNSGDPVYRAPQSGGNGSIKSGSLEMSNVDLSEEFTEMIVAQRGFQANTRIITTSDEILQELVNLKR